MRRVVLESPYAGDVEKNVAYARLALRDSIQRGEAPWRVTYCTLSPASCQMAYLRSERRASRPAWSGCVRRTPW